MVRRKKGRAAGYPQATSSPFASSGASAGAGPGFTAQDVLSEVPEAGGGGGGGGGGININIVNQAVATAINESGPGGVMTGPVSGGGGGAMMPAQMMMMGSMTSSASPYTAY